MTEKRAVSIQILDQTFQIFSDAPPAKIEKVAALLSEHIEAALTNTKSPLSYRTVILAALNITEQFVELTQAHQDLKAEVTSKSHKVLHLLEEIMPPPQEPGNDI